MKVLKAIKSFFLGLLGVLFFTFVLAMTILLLNFNDYGVTQFDDTSMILISDRISSKEYKKGDLVLVKEKTINDIKEGDLVFAYRVDTKGKANVDLGKVGRISKEDNAIEFQNGSAYSMDYVIGESTKIYPKIGNFLSIIESKWGFLFIVLVPGFLIFIYELYALICEIKYGKDEDE